MKIIKEPDMKKRRKEKKRGGGKEGREREEQEEEEEEAERERGWRIPGRWEVGSRPNISPG